LVVAPVMDHSRKERTKPPPLQQERNSSRAALAAYQLLRAFSDVWAFALTTPVSGAPAFPWTKPLLLDADVDGAGLPTMALAPLGTVSAFEAETTAPGNVSLA
jgi:hypothetical protein